MPTTIISTREAPRGWEAMPGYQYIGRSGRGHTGEWGNPFTVGQYGQGGACEQHRLWLRGEAHRDFQQERRQWILENLVLLIGKTLVCFCKPKDCHGDNYDELLENPALLQGLINDVPNGTQ